MAEEKLTAATRLEKILDNIAGGSNEITPATRLEKFLSYIADAMEGGGGSGGGCDCEIDSTNFIIREVPDNVPKRFYYYDGYTWIELGYSNFVNNAPENGLYYKVVYDDGEDYYYYRAGSYTIHTISNSNIGVNSGIYITSEDDISITEFISFYQDKDIFIDLTGVTIEYKEGGIY